MTRSVTKMDPVLKINGFCLCFATFALYSLYLHPNPDIWSLCLIAFLCWGGFIVYDINRDIVFRRVKIKEIVKDNCTLPAGEHTWQVV
jgi:hypothetical protein